MFVMPMITARYSLPLFLCTLQTDPHGMRFYSGCAKIVLKTIARHYNTLYTENSKILPFYWEKV